MNKQTKKYILNILLLVAIAGIALFFILKDDAGAIFETLGEANIWYLLLCFALALLAYFLDSLIMVILTRLYKDDYKVSQGFFNNMIGRFFSGITPSSTGGQFAQAYTFNKQGVSLVNSASILVMMFITYEISITIFGGFTILYSWLSGTMPTGTIDFGNFQLSISVLSLIGFFITFTFIVLMIVLALNKNIHRFVVSVVIKLGVFFRLIKKDKAEEKKLQFNTKVETFRVELKRLFSNIKILIIVIVVYLIQLFVINSIPFFAFRTCNYDMDFSLFMNSIVYSSFSTMITQFVPIPGASGGAEFVFNIMYGPFVNWDDVLIRSSMLVWRTASFYFGLFFGAFVLIFYHESPKLKTLHYSDRTLFEIDVIKLGDEYNLVKTEDQEPMPVKHIEIEDVTTYFDKIKKDLAEVLSANERALDEEDKENKKDE